MPQKNHKPEEIVVKLRPLLLTMQQAWLARHRRSRINRAALHKQKRRPAGIGRVARCISNDMMPVMSATTGPISDLNWI